MGFDPVLDDPDASVRQISQAELIANAERYGPYSTEAAALAEVHERNLAGEDVCVFMCCGILVVGPIATVSSRALRERLISQIVDHTVTGWLPDVHWKAP